MAEDLQIIRRFVGSLARRERLLLVLRVALQGLLLLVAILTMAVTSSATGWERPKAAFGVVLLAGVGGWFAIAWPLLRRWPLAGDPLRQARLVEEMAPELRGRLLTSVERIPSRSARADAGPRGQESAAVLGLVARRAAGVVTRVAIGSVHPARGVVRLAVAVAVAWIAWLALTVATPGGLAGVARWWTAGTRAEAAVAGLQVGVADDYARVGDLVLRYTYPAYTGLDPKVVPNSTGDITGPPGTRVEVTARTADPVQAAGIVAYEERLEAVVSEQGRQIVAGLSIAHPPGAYHLLLYRGAEPERSRDFVITPEEDLAPEVMLDAVSDRIEVPLDGGIELVWRARDDYGISKAVLSVGGEASPDPLFVAERRQAEASGTLRTSPLRLGLKPGDSVELQITAWDNDTVSGAKPGTSRPIQLVVLGARGMEQRLAAREAELLKLLVPILAEHVTDPWPPGDTSDEMTRWGEQVAHRYEPLHDAIERLWSGMSTDTYDSAIVSDVVATGNKLVRYTQVAFVPGSAEVPEAGSFTSTKELFDEAVVALEDAILLLLDMQEARALRDVAEQAKDLESAAQQLQELLAQENPDVQEMLARLDALERMMMRLMEAAAKLSDGGLQEYLNQRSSEVQRLMDEIRESLAKGDIERAKEQMERLQRQIQEMSQGVGEELERRKGEGEQMGEQIGAFRDELAALEQSQRDLQEQVRQLRDQADDKASAEAQKVWERLGALAGEVVTEGTAYRSALGEGAEGPGAPFLFNEQKRAESAVEESVALRDAIAARDIRGAQSAVIDADSGWLYTLRAAEGRRARREDGPPPKLVDGIRGKIEQIAKLLDQLDQLSQNPDPSTMKRSEELEQQQRDLEQRMEQARRQGEDLARRMPVRPDGLKEALDEAGQRMQQAGDDLGQGQPMQAEGSQGMAAERLRDAQEALERAMEQMQRQQQQMSGEGNQPQQGQPQDGDDGRNPSDPRIQPEIPGREEFRTPEEYRRALLEGMEGEVPEEYRALKKRYYEELVHQ